MVSKFFSGFYYPQDKFVGDSEFHSRLVAHIAEVYSVDDVSWQKCGKLWRPVGDLVLEDRLDFGLVIQSYCENGLKVREFVGDVVIDNKDGYIIEGKKYKISDYEESDRCRVVSSPFFNFALSSSNNEERKVFSYNFKINNSCMNVGNPKEFHIKNYVKIDGQDVFEETSVFRGRYERVEGEVMKFRKFVRTKK